ncbi:hypothetical protein EMCRGX_G022965 [Ephydatia muelleri]
MAKRTVERDEPPSTKKRPKRDCHFDKAWIQEFQGIGVSSKVTVPDKFNADSCCYDAEIPPELLKKCKKATSVTLGKE